MARRPVVAASIVLLLASTTNALAEETESRDRDFFTPHYILDYGLGTGGLMLELFYRGAPRESALIGPSFDPTNPAAILDPRHSDLLGGPFLTEDDWTVPNSWLRIAAYGQLLMVPAHELAAAWGTSREISAHRLHHMMLAVYQSTALNAGLTRVIKAHTGRLRPDFQERVRHVYCSLPDSEGIDCSDVDPERLFDDPNDAQHELLEGRYSFISGHSSNAMVVATNLALQTGGLWVWGEGATSTTQAVGIPAMGVLLGLGAFSGISRTSLMDGVHHTSDVVVGSLVGVALANVFYWLHFDTRGNPRAHHWLNRRGSSSRDERDPSNLGLIFGGTSIAVTGSW